MELNVDGLILILIFILGCVKIVEIFCFLLRFLLELFIFFGVVEDCSVGKDVVFFDIIKLIFCLVFESLKIGCIVFLFRWFMFLCDIRFCKLCFLLFNFLMRLDVFLINWIIFLVVVVIVVVGIIGGGGGISCFKFFIIEFFFVWCVFILILDFNLVFFFVDG